MRTPELKWREGQPISQQFDDPYFSVDNGLAESRYVFIAHNGLLERWQHWPWADTASFNIVETGFGTGLNFLATWQAWREYLACEFISSPTSARPWLHFSSIEKYPLNHAQLKQALALWPELSELSSLLLQQYPTPKAGVHHLIWPAEKLSLTLWFADIKEALPQLSVPVHAWYLDGFAPSKNPEMWNDSLFHGMRRLSQSAHFQQPILYPTVATFTAAGIVKRGLQGAGFKLKKQAGFGRKRDMLTGVYYFQQGPEQPSHCWQKPWLARSFKPVHKVAVIGAGLAGCYSARALAERGIAITLFDPKGVAQAASGNPQGGVYLKLNANDSALESQFQLQAFDYALQSFKRYLGEGSSDNPHWQQCGLLQLAFDEKEQQRQTNYVQTHGDNNQLFTVVNAQQASELAGVELNQGGFFFPQAGWANPQALCKKLLEHPLIQFQQQAIHQLDELTNQFDHIIVATATNTATLLPTQHLPSKTIRGQLTYLQAERLPKFKTVLSGACYLSPIQKQTLHLGATYDAKDSNPDLSEQDHLANLNNLAGLGPSFQQLAQQGLKAVVGGRVGFRCSAPDYLPMVGALSQDGAAIEAFRVLEKDSKAIPKVAMPQHNNIWLNIAHGSKALVSAPLCAEILACHITGAALPVSLDIAEALWPGRFLMRDLARKKFAR